MSKYNNKRTMCDGHTFDSMAEAYRYSDLRLLEQAGTITHLRLQPSFQLQPAFTDAQGRKHRAIVYRADFSYQEGGALVVEDVKGAMTQVFRLKERLFRYQYATIDFRVLRVGKDI